MYVSKAYQEYKDYKSVRGFIELRNKFENYECEYAVDLDWLGIQAMQTEAGFDVGFQNELALVADKYRDDLYFWSMGRWI